MDSGQALEEIWVDAPRGGQHDNTVGQEETVATKGGTTVSSVVTFQGDDVGSQGLDVDTRIPVASLKLPSGTRLAYGCWTQRGRTWPWETLKLSLLSRASPETKLSSSSFSRRTPDTCASSLLSSRP
jgi:hypothetical protein